MRCFCYICDVVRQYLYRGEIRRRSAGDDGRIYRLLPGVVRDPEMCIRDRLVNQENSFKVSTAQKIAAGLSQYDLQVTVQALPNEEYLQALSLIHISTPRAGKTARR